MGSLGACLLLSLVINLVGFAPMMNSLLGRGAADSPRPEEPLQVRLLNARLEPPRMPSPTLSAPEKPRPSTAPKKRPEVARMVKPIPARLPEDSVPRARPRSKTPPKTPPQERPQTAPPALSQPEQSAGIPMPPMTPSSPKPPAETPAPPPTDPPPPPVSDETNPDQAAVPDTRASPIGFPPRQSSRLLMNKLGGKLMVRLGLTIHTDGHIDSKILVSSGNAELDAAVLEDLKDWRWNPAVVGGKPTVSEEFIRLKLEAD